jgi:electron transport complex protein RnfC
VIVNVATLDAVGEWLATGAPVTRRLVAVCGPALRSQGTAWVRIGHVVREVIAAFGVDAADASRLTLRDGGVVSGRTVSPAAGIARTTLGLHATTASAPDALPCIRCGRCAEVCPERLAPQILHGHATEQRLRGLVDAGLDACIECGACDLVCPSGIPLLTEFRAGKRAVLAQRTAEARADSARRRVEAHEQRVKATAASAEARRRARLATRLGPPSP